MSEAVQASAPQGDAGSNANGDGQGSGKLDSHDPKVNGKDQSKPVTHVGEPLKAEKKRYKVKDPELGDQEIELDEDTLLAQWRHRKYADKTLNDAAKLRQQSEAFIQKLRTDPWAVLSDPRIGHDAKKLAEQYLTEQIEDEMLTDEQRENKTLKKQLEEMKRAENEKKAKEENAKKEELRQKYAADYQKEILDALVVSGLPKSPMAVRRMAHYMHQSLKLGSPLSAKDVVHMVKEDFMKEQLELFGGLEGDALEALLGKDIQDKLRKHNISKIKQKEPEFKSRPFDTKAIDEQRNTQKKPLTNYEWRAKRERIKQGLE